MRFFSSVFFKMHLCVIFMYIVLDIYGGLGQAALQGIFRQRKPCFETVKSECNSTLIQSFEPKSPNFANLEPRTLIFLFTQRNQEKAESLHECGGRLPPGSTYDPEAETEIFIHGWLDGICRTKWMRESKEQLYKRAFNYNSSYNVILVDWTWGNTPDYDIAGFNSKIVGEQLGFVINNIMNQTRAKPEKFHVIGHSYGAVAGGFIGRSVKGLRRITALDPAYAPLTNPTPDQRITYRDAKIVDVIHTNSLDNLALAIGDERLLGHADFYPNGGFRQPSCIDQIFKSSLRGDYYYALGSLEPRLCSHLMSITYYKLSINPGGCQYVGVASNSYSEFLNRSSESPITKWEVMGMDFERYYKDDGTRRKYFLTTTNFSPYYDNSYLGEEKFPFEATCTAQ